MADISGLVTGLSDAIGGYFKGQVENKQQLEQYKAKKQIDDQSSDKPNEVSPDMAEQLIPGASKWINSFQQQNNRLPSIDEVSKGLVDVQSKLSAMQGKAAPKPNIKHYMGNDPNGNAIFSDNDGKMTSPDGSSYSGKVLPKSSTMPTSSTRSSAEFATTLLPHIQEMRQMIQEADSKGYIGPASGRMYNQFMAGAVGSTGNDDADRLLGKLRSMDSLLKSGAMRVHFGSRGGQNMYQHFSDMLNTGKQSAAQLNGSLDTLESFMQGYSQAGQPQGASQSNDPLGIL